MKPLTVLLSLALAASASETRAQGRAHYTVPDPTAVLTSWFHHIERNEFDSLPPLLTPEFLFVSDGARMDAASFVRMIRSLGISHPRVTLSNIVHHQSGNIAYLVYDRIESFQSRGVTKTVPETGTMVLEWDGKRWAIALWTTTSPPSRATAGR